MCWYVFNSSIQEAEAGGLKVQSQPGIHREVKANLSCNIADFVFKRKRRIKTTYPLRVSLTSMHVQNRADFVFKRKNKKRKRQIKTIYPLRVSLTSMHVQNRVCVIVRELNLFINQE